MIQKQKVLALIPARGGSKGIKEKNIYPLCGKPLISYTLEAAEKSRYIDRILVSTDSVKIAGVAKIWGQEPPFLRPGELAADDSKSIDAVLHALRQLKGVGEVFDILVLLQPTQPLRTARDIDDAVEVFVKMGKRPLASVCEVDNHPLLTRRLGEDGMLRSLLPEGSTVRRQDMEPFYRVNGCIYINRVDEITDGTSFNDNQVPYVMPKERSVDIDEPRDVVLAEYYIKNRGDVR